MRIRTCGWAVMAVGILTFFWLVSVAGAVESAASYRSVYSSGYKTVSNPENFGTTLSFQANVPKSYLLRYYVPPAANGSTTLALFCAQTGSIGVVARLGAPPQCDTYSNATATSISSTSYNSLPWDERPGTLQELRSRDWRVRNGSGTISIVYDNNSSSKGEWLFIKVLFDGTSIPSVAKTSFGVGVNKAAYTEWYNSMNWESNGDPGLTVSSVAMGPCDFTSTGTGTVPVDTNTYYTITVQQTGDGYISPSGSVKVLKGNSQKFSFMIDPIFGVSKEAGVQQGPLYGTMTDMGVRTEYTFSNVQQNMLLKVTFGADAPTPTETTYSITVYTDGAGTVSPASVSLVAGGSQTFTFYPASGWEVSQVTYGTVGGVRSASSNKSSYTFNNVQSNMELGVVFSEIVESTMYEANDTFLPIKIIPVPQVEILTFSPTIQFANPPEGLVNCYVGYLCQGKLFMGRKEFNGNVVFEPYNAEVGLLRYGTYNFEGGTVWEPDVFVKAKLQTGLISTEDVQFIVAVASDGDLGTLQGCIFQFVPAQ